MPGISGFAPGALDGLMGGSSGMTSNMSDDQMRQMARAVSGMAEGKNPYMPAK